MVNFFGLFFVDSLSEMPLVPREDPQHWNQAIAAPIKTLLSGFNAALRLPYMEENTPEIITISPLFRLSTHGIREAGTGTFGSSPRYGVHMETAFPWALSSLYWLFLFQK